MQVKWSETTPPEMCSLIITFEASELILTGQRRLESLTTLWPKVVKVDSQDVLEAPRPPETFAKVSGG